MTMSFRTQLVKPVDVNAELLLVGVYENALNASALAQLDAAGGTTVAQAVAANFTGKHAQVNVQYAARGRVVFFGLGDRNSLDHQQLREALEAAFKEARKQKVSRVAIAEVDCPEGVSRYDFGRLVGETSGLVDYVMVNFKTPQGGHKPEPRITDITVAVNAAPDDAVREGLKHGRAVAACVNMGRDLVALPAGHLYPMELANRAIEVAQKSSGRITCNTYRKAQLKRMGANALLAVSQGSQNEPVLIELNYMPEGADSNVTLALIGKSVTFDSGGYDLKPADGMRWMKTDMAGGASTLAAIAAIAELNLPVRVKVVMAATENLCSHTAYKPGDVLHTMAGLTVEVDNTDAEGRLTLADAIEFAKRGGATHIVDVATLTGAIRIALGGIGAGAFTNNDELAGKVVEACGNAGELVHLMPMWKQFAKANDSKIADLKNSGGAAFGAGSITAAWFLRKFAGDTPWVHLDIAGVAFKDEEGTGWGIRSLVELARLFSKQPRKS